MLILGIESASDQCGCALANEGGVIAETRLALPRRHAEALAPQMRFVCEQAGVALADIEAVAVDHGPGLYTGLRAGLATAKATAAALEIGVVPVGSLEALAHGAAAVARPGETVLSVLDARRGEVFWAWYRITVPTPARPSATPPASSSAPPSASSSAPPSASSSVPPSAVSSVPPSAASSAPPSSVSSAPPSASSSASPSASSSAPPSASSSAPPGAARSSRLVQLSAPQVGPPADLLPALTSPGDQPSGRTVVVGDGALRYADLLGAANAVIGGPELRFPSPVAVALLGRERALAGETHAPEQVDALYLRSPDAKPQP